MKNQKGITLIALVITIIVLLILAGVSIAMLSGQNGILTQADNSKAATAKAEAVEKINLTLNAIKTEIYKQQVTTSTWSPLGDTDDTISTSDGIKDAITQIIQADLGTVTNGAATLTDGTYDYKYDATSKKLIISYKNAQAGVDTAVVGKIKLVNETTTESYDIEPATK